MSDRLRCGVVGLGVGEQHALAYRNDPRCELVALCDGNSNKRAEVGARFPDVPMFASWQEMADAAKLDVVSIAGSDDTHADQVVSALERGLDVFAEKPLCQNSADLARIRLALEKSGRLLLTNLILRKAPAFVGLKEAIAAGELGALYAFDGDYLYGRLHKIVEGWRGQISFYSVIQGGAVHLIDLMQWCLGELPAEACAIGNQIASRNSAFRFPDFVATTFRFPSGLIGRITANFGCVHRHQHVVRAFGTKGTFISDSIGPRIIHAHDGDMTLLGSQSPLPTGKGFLIPDFLDAIECNDAGRSEIMRSHLQTMALCLAADESLATGHTVKISYE
jgi:predicted dehydrogenase